MPAKARFRLLVRSPLDCINGSLITITKTLLFAHWVIMPNHLHLLTTPMALENPDSFQMVWRRFKGRSSRFINGILSGNGTLWQDSLYDRWVRHEPEFNGWIDCFRSNPVKAGLAAEPEGYPYMQ
jgi:REP element-mobilizing transposase RayT